MLICLSHSVVGQDGIYGYTDEHGVLHLSNVPNDARYKLMLGHSAQHAESEGSPAARSMPGTLPYRDEVAAAARKHEVDPALIHAVIQAESNSDPRAVSTKGATGLMQLMPDTARRYGVRNIRDPQQNIEGGTRYLSDLIRMFGGDLKLVLAAYNAGENAVIRYGNRIPPFAETLQYVPRVLEFYRRLATVRTQSGSPQ